MAKSHLLRLVIIALFLVLELKHVSCPKPKTGKGVVAKGNSKPKKENDMMANVYPDVRRCYKKFSRPDEWSAREAQNTIIDTCNETYSDQNSFCHKVCRMTEQAIISLKPYHNDGQGFKGKRYFVYFVETTNYPFGQELLGVNEQLGNKVTDRLMTRYLECAKQVVKLPPDTPGDCHLLSKKDKKLLAKMHKCIETALTCSNEMDDIDPDDAHTEDEIAIVDEVTYVEDDEYGSGKSLEVVYVHEEEKK